MAHRFGYPDAIEGRFVWRVTEEVSHSLRVQFLKPNTSTTKLDDTIAVHFRILAGSFCFLQRQLVRELDLPTADRYPSDSAAMFLRQVSRRPTDPASNIKHTSPTR